MYARRILGHCICSSGTETSKQTSPQASAYGSLRLDAAEKALGEAEGRERVKTATREAMLAEARAHLTADANAGS